MNPQVDKYISSIEKFWQRKVCIELRELLHQADPEIKEFIKWRAPYFEHAGGIAWMFCATDWVHFSFPKGALLDAPKDTWEEDKDTLSKGKRTLKFRENQLVSKDLIINLVKQAASANIQGKKPNYQITKPGSQEYNAPAVYAKIIKENELYEEYLSRPYYQQKGWIEWIKAAKQTATSQKRIDMMLSELQHGQYMPNKADRI